MKNIIIYSVFLLFLNSYKQNLNNGNKSNVINSEFDNKNSTTLSDKNKTKECFSSQLRVYLNDPDKSGTNIRRTPKGEIITKLITDDLNHDYLLTVTESKNGWFKVKTPIIGMENDVEIPNGEGWIHGSVISVDTRNYGGQHLNLLDKPIEGKIIKVIKKEVIELRLKDMCGDWVKIEYNKAVGWIESKWLCGNPLTNCS